MRSFIKYLLFWILKSSEALNSAFIRAHSVALNAKFPNASQASYVELLSKFDFERKPIPLRRFGTHSDGGYVLLDAINPDAVCISLGIADEISFDDEISSLISQILMFDYSISKPPHIIENATFQALRVVPLVTNHKFEIDMKTIFENLDANQSVILKVDIEGSEWESFMDFPRESMLRCEQIIFEFHGLQSLYQHANFKHYLQFLDRILETHEIVNSHINNWDSFEIIEGIPVPNVLEVTYVRKDLVAKLEGQENSQTVNYPNNSSRADFLLHPLDRVLKSSK